MDRSGRIWQTIGLRPRDQSVLACLAVLGLVCLVTYVPFPLSAELGYVPLDQLERRDATFCLDINSASTTEWRLLPGIGESLAERIVESRRRDGPFRNREELRRVRGIGPKTLARIRPYLLPASAPLPHDPRNGNS